MEYETNYGMIWKRKKKKSKTGKKEKSKVKEESRDEQVGFPDDIDFNKFLGCGG